MPVVLVTATFTGMVLALQSWSGFQRFQATSFVGSVVALSITRELGPVFAGLMVSGRVGAAMAAESRDDEGHGADRRAGDLATNPVSTSPAWSLLRRCCRSWSLADLSAYWWYFVAVSARRPYVYINKTYQYLEFKDIYTGLVKAAFDSSRPSPATTVHRGGWRRGRRKATTRAVVAFHGGAHLDYHDVVHVLGGKVPDIDPRLSKRFGRKVVLDGST